MLGASDGLGQSCAEIKHRQRERVMGSPDGGVENKDVVEVILHFVAPADGIVRRAFVHPNSIR